MFSSLGLFQNLSCPDKTNCKRPRCIFSHREDLPPPPSIHIPVEDPAPAPSGSSVRDQSPPKGKAATIPAKRPVAISPLRANGASSATPGNIGEPPRKLQKLGHVQRPLSLPSAQQTTTGVPVLRVNAAQSQVALPVRQAMLKSLYNHFVVLYAEILPSNPTLAAEHSLRQEEEVYRKSTKLTYRNAVISSIAALKKRPVPNSSSHSSVGTEGDLAVRAESRKSLDALRITHTHLESFVMSLEILEEWGYVVSMPDGIGGDRPSAEGQTAKCDRCAQPFMVKRKDEAEECIYHWGKPFTKSINGERIRTYSCCSRPTATGEGCIRGPHVFYESKPEDLHARHAFTYSRSPSSEAEDTALDVVALDCEMIYTTGGMRVARVSVVDGSGAEIMDEFIRMDDEVEVIDYNTRFSGVTEENLAKGLLPLVSIRKSLDAYVNSRTILVGHALDNDLKTLRMIHHRCVDTAILFPHRAGPPYRRALRDLVKEHLGTVIQTGGGTVGHSSVEDSVATLDLVRWYVLNKPKPKPPPSSVPQSNKDPGDLSNL